MSEEICSKGVIVGTDGSPSAVAAVRWAVSAARMRQVPLGVVHVADADAATDRAADDVLTGAVATASAEAAGGEPEIGSAQLAGDPTSTLAELSRTATMVVVGRHGGATRMHRLLGSVSTGVLHHARCPVAVVHADPKESARARRQPVLVGVDGSRSSAAAAEIAFDEASWRGVGVVALYVCDGADAQDRGAAAILREAAECHLDTVLTPLRERHPDVVAHRLIRFESPARQLLVQGERAQLVVVGSHGRGAVAGMLLGSVSAAVARDVRVPVIVARHG